MATKKQIIETLTKKAAALQAKIKKDKNELRAIKNDIYAAKRLNDEPKNNGSDET